MKRRKILQVMAGSTGVSLAGCADLLGDEESDQSVDDDSPEPETPDDQGSTDTPEDTQSDVPVPNVTELDVAMTDRRGMLSYSLAIEDEESTLSSLRLRTPTDEKIIHIDDSVFETSGDIDAEPGRMNDLELIAENADDGTVEETAAAYARRHEEQEIDTEIHVSPVYHMFMGRGGPDGRSKWPDCAVGKPEIGEYSHDPSDFDKANRGAFERHFDDMHGYSIDTTSVLFDETDKSRPRLSLYGRR